MAHQSGSFFLYFVRLFGQRYRTLHYCTKFGVEGCKPSPMKLDTPDDKNPNAQPIGVRYALPFSISGSADTEPAC
jgi:hypothetical protein